MYTYGQSYYTLGNDGGIFAFGNATYNGMFNVAGHTGLFTAIAADPNGCGFWAVDSSGQVYAWGNPNCSASNQAQYWGGYTPASGTTIVGIAATPDGGGYWLVSNTGAVYTPRNASGGGDSQYNGGLGINYGYGGSAIVGIATGLNDGSFWTVDADGHDHPFAAVDYGDVASGTTDIVGLTPTADAEGYWVVGQDGGVFTFGNASFYGSTPGTRLPYPVVGLAATPDDNGYWLAGSDGGVIEYGDAYFLGSMAAVSGVPAGNYMVGIIP